MHNGSVGLSPLCRKDLLGQIKAVHDPRLRHILSLNLTLYTAMNSMSILSGVQAQRHGSEGLSAWADCAGTGSRSDKLDASAASTRVATKAVARTLPTIEQTNIEGCTDLHEVMSGDPDHKGLHISCHPLL